MARWNICSPCVKVIQTRLNHPSTGKRNKNTVNKYEKDNPCEDLNPTNKRRKIMEAEILHSAGHGGQIWGEITLAPYLSDMNIDPEARADHPNDLTKNLFLDDATYDAYVAIFMKYGDVAKSTSSADVLA